MKNLKDNFGIYLIIVAIVGGILTWTNLPKQVSAMQNEIDANQKHLGNLTVTVEKYIAVQAAKEEFQERREALLIQLIEKMAK